MLDRLRRLLLAVAALIVSAVGLTVPAQAAGSDAASCTSGGGVWVVVADLRSGCATNPANGVDALKQIGVTVSESKGMLCALDNKPEGACTKTFAQNGEQYWMYFHAMPGGTWAFSQEGAAQYKPKPGSVEGWVWGKTEATTPPMPSFDATASTTSPSATASATPAEQKKSDGMGLLLPLGVTALVVLGGLALYALAGRKAAAAHTDVEETKER